jgi:hypothetical protein
MVLDVHVAMVDVDHPAVVIVPVACYSMFKNNNYHKDG